MYRDNRARTDLSGSKCSTLPRVTKVDFVLDSPQYGNNDIERWTKSGKYEALAMCWIQPRPLCVNRYHFNALHVQTVMNVSTVLKKIHQRRPDLSDNLCGKCSGSVLDLYTNGECSSSSCSFHKLSAKQSRLPI